MKIGVYFVIGIMIFSTFGYALLFSDDDSDSEDVEDFIPAADPIAIGYEANLDGEVINLQPVFILIADTNISNIIEIDRNIQSASGVSSVQSNYKLNDASIGTGTYLYFATITTFDSNYEHVKDEIRDSIKYSVTNTDFRQYGEVKFDKNVLFTNADLNIEKRYEFGVPMSNVILWDGTLEGDEISFVLFAQFIENSLSTTEGEMRMNRSLNKIEALEGKFNFVQNNASLYITGDLNNFDLNSIEAFFSENDQKFMFAGQDPQYISYNFIVDGNLSFAESDLVEFLDENYDYELYRNGALEIDSIELNEITYDYTKQVITAIPYSELKSENLNFKLQLQFMREELQAIYAEYIG
jgi:hypothetical protein